MRPQTGFSPETPMAGGWLAVRVVVEAMGEVGASTLEVGGARESWERAAQTRAGPSYRIRTFI